nr:MAG TPA: hypothetical protein [Caudoviricetes sp.]
MTIIRSIEGVNNRKSPLCDNLRGRRRVETHTRGFPLVNSLYQSWNPLTIEKRLK